MISLVAFVHKMILATFTLIYCAQLQSLVTMSITLYCICGACPTPQVKADGLINCFSHLKYKQTTKNLFPKRLVLAILPASNATASVYCNKLRLFPDCIFYNSRIGAASHRSSPRVGAALTSEQPSHRSSCYTDQPNGSNPSSSSSWAARPHPRRHPCPRRLHRSRPHRCPSRPRSLRSPRGR